MAEINNRIRERRLEMGLTVDELAEKLGKNRETIISYESDDKESVPASLIGPLSLALEVGATYLMGWSENLLTGKELASATYLDAFYFREFFHVIKILRDNMDFKKKFRIVLEHDPESPAVEFKYDHDIG